MNKLELVKELFNFLFWASLIIIISKFFLVKVLRELGKALNLRAKTIGNITGIATSIPEFLTVSISAITGFAEAGIYNILSSNIINCVQYIISIIANKNQKLIYKKEIKITLLLVILTILIPLGLVLTKLETNIWIIIIFFLLFIIFYKINDKTHILCIKSENEVKEKNKIKKRIQDIIKYVIILIIISIILYLVGNFLSESLIKLGQQFGIKEVTLGILLGFITSIP